MISGDVLPIVTGGTRPVCGIGDGPEDRPCCISPKSPKLVLVHITSPPVELAQRQQIDQSAVGSSLATRRGSLDLHGRLISKAACQLHGFQVSDLSVTGWTAPICFVERSSS